jgi:NADH-quinone oxidoreductase subunit M
MMIAISIASILYGGLIALGQKDIKKLVAYSSVAHMGFVTLGIFVFTQRGGEGAILQMLNHGITTGALFMLIGLIYERSHSREISANQGLGKYMPAFLFFWGLFSMSSLAFPGTNSFVGEVLVLAGTFEVNNWAGFLASPGAMLAAAYMLRLWQLGAWCEPSSFKKNWLDMNGREWIYLLPLAFLVFYIGFVPGPALRLVSPSIATVLSTVQDKNHALGYRQDMPLAECMKLEPAARVADGAAAGVSLPGKERL